MPGPPRKIIQAFDLINFYSVDHLAVYSQSEKLMRHIKGLKDLVFDAIEHTVNLVERTHIDVAEKYTRRVKWFLPIAPVKPVAAAHHLVARGVYSSIRTVTKGVRMSTNAGFSLAFQGLGEEYFQQRGLNPPLRSTDTETLLQWLDTAQGALNGTVGDYLNKRGNGLEIAMGLRHAGRPLAIESEQLARALPNATRKICLFVHGLGCTEESWNIFAEQFHGDPRHNFGALLQRDLGYTPLYVRYNSGLHVSENGRRLADLIEELSAVYPEPIEELVLIGHSMGGLVVRSAVHYGALDRRSWISHLTHVICIGTPHHGAPLEQVGNLLTSVLRYFDTPGTQIPAQILNLRSAGIKDLRFGYVVDEDWAGHDPDALFQNNRRDIPFLQGVGYYFIASTISRDSQHPARQWIGDLLVHLPSAQGQSLTATGQVFCGMHHFHILNHPDVYQQIKRWCSVAAKP